MRKYRNGKKSQRLQGDNKYSESYLEYSHARGSRSVKSIVFDTDGNGDVDTILKAWRHPAVRKGNYFDSSTDQPTLPLGAQHAPTNISLIVTPESAPTGVSLTASPQVAPTGISATTILTEGPTGISAIASPQVAPTGITLNLDRDEDGVYADADFDDNDDQVGSVVPPTSPPTGISALPSPQVAPTGISATEEPNYSSISFEGQTYDLIEEASNGITVTPRTTSSGNITASRVNDDGEILIPISANSLWGSENNQTLYGPVFNFKQSDPEAHYVAVSCTSSGNTNIITQNLGSAVFQNGIASRAIDKWIAHERNIISGSTTRSKTVVELVWKSISNETIKTEYYKIGFQQLINPPQVAPTNISIFSPNSSAMVAGVKHEFEAVLSTGFMRTNPNNQNTQYQEYGLWRNTTLGLEIVTDYVAPTFEAGSQYSIDPGSLTQSIRPIVGGGKVLIQTIVGSAYTMSPNWLIEYGAYVNGSFVSSSSVKRITLSRTGQDWEYNIVAPQVAPTNISVSLDLDEDGVYSGQDYDDTDAQLGQSVYVGSVPDTNAISNVAENTAIGASINISASAKSGYVFSHWEILNGSGTFGDVNSANTTFIPTAHDNGTVALYARSKLPPTPKTIQLLHNYINFGLSNSFLPTATSTSGVITSDEIVVSTVNTGKNVREIELSDSGGDVTYTALTSFPISSMTATFVEWEIRDSGYQTIQTLTNPIIDLNIIDNPTYSDVVELVAQYTLS